MFCQKCGTQIAENADFCHKCGQRVVTAELHMEIIEDEPSHGTPDEQPPAEPLQSPSEWVESELKKARHQIEYGYFDLATQILDEILLIDSENAEVYYLKTLADHTAKSIDGISMGKIKTSGNYAKALQYASEEEKALWGLVLLPTTMDAAQRHTEQAPQEPLEWEAAPVPQHREVPEQPQANGNPVVFCRKCGSKISEGADFCHKCGTKAFVANDSVNSHVAGRYAESNDNAVLVATEVAASNVNNRNTPVFTQHEQSGMVGLCIPMCILKFIDAAMWTVIVIIQFSLFRRGDGTLWDIVLNAVATIVTYVFAARLLEVCRDNVFKRGRIDQLAKQNIGWSGFCVVFYLIQLIFMDVSDIIVLSLLLETAILILAIVLSSKFSKRGI